MKSTGLIGWTLIGGLNTHSGELRWECFCRHRYSSPESRSQIIISYPLSYSLIVLPVTVARWLLFGHHHVPSAVTFFADSIFHLSGAINVLLFLLIRPELLLFPRPQELCGEEVELAPQCTGPAISSDTVEVQHGLEPTSSVLGEGIRGIVTPYGVSSRRTSDDI